MVTDVGGLGDKSFNDSAYAGLRLAKSELGAQIEVLQSKSAADYQPNLTALANENYDDIFAIGFLMNKDLSQVASTFPKQNFAIVDAVVDQPNVTSLTFREQDGSFLAGALAARVSKTKDDRLPRRRGDPAAHQVRVRFPRRRARSRSQRQGRREIRRLVRGRRLR